MGSKLTNPLRDGEATTTGPLPAGIGRMELLTRLQRYTDDFRKEISNMVEEERKGKLFRQYIDYRLIEIAEILNSYNKARVSKEADYYFWFVLQFNAILTFKVISSRSVTHQLVCVSWHSNISTTCV